MRISIEEKQEKAIESLKKLDIYKPYIKGFKTEGPCFFEEYVGFWANQEPKLMEKIKEFEKEHDALVYAITHEITTFGECYSFLYVSDYKEDNLRLIPPTGQNNFYVSAYVWNVSDDWCSEFGSIVVKSFGGGIKRIG